MSCRIIEDYRKDFLELNKGCSGLTNNNERRRITLGLVATRKFRRNAQESDSNERHERKVLIPVSQSSHGQNNFDIDTDLSASFVRFKSRNNYARENSKKFCDKRNQINYKKNGLGMCEEYLSGRSSSFPSSPASPISQNHHPPQHQHDNHHSRVLIHYRPHRLKTPIQIWKNGTTNISDNLNCDRRHQPTNTRVKHRSRVYITNDNDIAITKDISNDITNDAGGDAKQTLTNKNPTENDGPTRQTQPHVYVHSENKENDSILQEKINPYSSNSSQQRVNMSKSQRRNHSSFKKQNFTFSDAEEVNHIYENINSGSGSDSARDTSFCSGSSKDSQEDEKPKLVGILKSPGKRKHFRKHVEFLDRHENHSSNVRYF